MKDLNHYYERNKRRMMREFHSIFRGMEKGLLRSLGKREVLRVKRECINAYVRIYQDLPYLGGFSRSSTINLVMGAINLSIINTLEKEGFSEREIGRSIYEGLRGYFYAKPRPLRRLIGKIASSKWFIQGIKKEIDHSQQRNYKGDFLLEHAKPGSSDFELGYDYRECAIQKYYETMGKEKYVKYLCLGDHIMFKSYGIGYSRTQTLGNGAKSCDFRFGKKYQSMEAWPPENLKEWNNTAG